ncbi:hypothetical protein Tco_1136521 [Tanacetum coccineum]
MWCIVEENRRKHEDLKLKRRNNLSRKLLDTCSLWDVTTKFNRPDRNVDPPPLTCQFQVFRSLCKSIGLRSVIRFDAQELKKVIWYALHNSPEIDTYRSQFKSKFPNKDMKKEFPDWFGSQIRQRHVDNDPGVSATNELFVLACRPTPTSISVNSCIVNGVRCEATEIRGHGGDGGGDDRPPSHHIPTGCGGCFANRGKGTRKANLGGRKAGRLHTRQETRNLGLKKITDDKGPVPIRFEWDDKKTMMPLGGHASHWSNYLGELIREMPLYYPILAEGPAERKAASQGRLESLPRQIGMPQMVFWMIPGTKPRAPQNRQKPSKDHVVCRQGSLITARLRDRCRFQQNPGELHWTAVKNILKYLRNTKDMFLVYGGYPEAKLRVDCYCDAEFETDRDDTKSQTGYVFILNGGAVYWESSMQSTTAMSATEPGVQRGAKHYHRRYHYARESIALGEIRFFKVHKDDNLADPFTKALSKTKLTQNTKSIGLRLASSFM